MLKKLITYTDFNDVEVAEEFHFHLSKADLVEMEAQQRGGLQAHLTKIIETNDGAAIISEFKKLIMQSIGKVSEDGKRFEKSDEIRDNFRQSPAYSELFMELATNADAAANFVNGIIPQGLADDVAKIGEVANGPQRERNETERGKPVKTLTQEEAQALSQKELVERMKDGWIIQS